MVHIHDMLIKVVCITHMAVLLTIIGAVGGTHLHINK